MFTCGIHVACWFETSISIEFDLFLNNTGPATQCSNLHCRVCCCHRTTVFGIDITSCGILCKYHINYKFSCLLLIFNTTFPSFTVASLPGSEVYTACWTVVGWRISHSVWVLTVWQELLMAKHSSVEHLQTFCEKFFTVQPCEDHAHSLIHGKEMGTPFFIWWHTCMVCTCFIMM